MAAYQFTSCPMKTILTPLERERHDVIRSCIDRDLTNAEAAARLGLKIRQVQNLKRAVESGGEQGIVHGNHGRVSNHATHPETVSAVVAYLNQE